MPARVRLAAFAVAALVTTATASASLDNDDATKTAGGTFRSAEPGENPDTLERDHIMLMVSRVIVRSIDLGEKS